MLAIAVTTVLVFIQAFAPLVEVWAAGRAARSGGSAPAAVAAAVELVVLAGLLIGYALAGLTFLGWLARAYRNVPALGGAPPRFGAGLAVGAWFIPVANWVLPYLVVADLARASATGADSSGPDRVAVRLVRAWWPAFLGTGLLLAVGLAVGQAGEMSRARSAMAGGRSVDLDLVRHVVGEQVLARLPAAVACLVTAVLAVTLVDRVTSGQYARLTAACRPSPEVR